MADSMLPNSMEIIDLSSDSEEGIIDLSSDSEDNTFFLPYTEEEVDYDDPVSPFHLSFYPHNTALGLNSMEEFDDWRVLAKKEYDDYLFRTNASSSNSPVDDISTTELNNKLPQSFTYGSFIPQSFAPSHSRLGDNRFKEEPSMTFSGFQRCTSSGSETPSSTVPLDDIFVYGGPCPHRIFPPAMPSSVNGTKVENDVEQRLFSPEEKVVYEEALKHITQETKEEDLPKGVMSVKLLKHQKKALAWMLSKENSSHCPGGILADDQGLGKTISTIALILKEMVKQSRFMIAGSYSTKFVLNSDYDNDDDLVIVMAKKEPKDEPLNELDDSAQLHVASSLKLCDSKSNAATHKAEPYDNDDVGIAMPKKELKDEPLNELDDSAQLHVASSLKLCDSKSNANEVVGIVMPKKELKDEPLNELDDSARLHVASSLKLCDSKSNAATHKAETYDNEVVGIVMPKKELKDEPLNELDDSARLHVASSLKLCDSKSNTATDKAEPKKKTRVKYSASNLRSKTRPAAGTLVVCPASVLRQWANELSVKVMEDNKLSVLVYHGSSRTKDPNELAKYDVVVTTYMTVANEVPKENSNDEQKDSELDGICPEVPIGSKRKRQSKPKKKNKPINLEGGPLARVRWFRVVLDEAQTIKNYRTQVSRACCGLRAERRWCLSGTPIQNKIDDLYSYFCFLKYEPYSKFSHFKYMIKHQITRDSIRGYKKLQAILRIILLRRTKETLIDGEPILKLPPKTVQLSKIDFTQEERAFYLALEEGSRQKFKAYDAAGTIRENYANILVLLLRLRQACDHPLLLNGHESDLIDSNSIKRAKQLPKETVTDLLEKLERGPAICSICNDPPEDAVVTTCGHVFCYQCVYESLTSDGHVCPYALCGKKLSFRSVFTPAVLKLCTEPKLEFHQKTSCSTQADKPSSICESSYISSKIQAAVDILNSIIKTPALTVGDTTESFPSMAQPVKAIVFSQWTGMLDLLQLSLNSNDIQFRRLDGSMSLNLREQQVNEFKTDPKVRVMLMSLKAGNLGLNMVAACHVIMLDPWWNPYAEDQAVDRAHRIGQTRPVTVSRFTVKDTVEDRILALQEKKRKMVESAFGEDGSRGAATKLTVEDLRYLFMV